MCDRTDSCDKEWIYKYHEYEWAIKMVCEDCLNKIYTNYWAVMYKWEYYNYDNPNVWRCNNCWHPAHREQLDQQNWYCMSCFYRRNRWTWHSAYYCPECGCMHTWLCTWGITSVWAKVTSSFRFVISNASKSWSAKWEAHSNDKYIQSIWQYQIERTLDEDTKKLLEEFYRWYKKFNHYYTREPITIKWEVSYYNYKALNEVYDAISDIKQMYNRQVINGKQVCKYYNHYLQWIDSSWLIKRKYVDVFGNVKEKVESINKFMKEVWWKETNEQMTWEFRYVLSSDIRHKITAFKLNEVVRSCQKSNNCDSYARWAYDAIVNWCNCPILIYPKNWNQPFARITTRILYDKYWQEYILIDRIYHNWEFWDAAMKGSIYKAIVEDIKKQWYKVIASNYSAHDNSTYSYLASLWMKSETVVRDLCQPLRRLIGWYGYYCDWGTEVLTWEVDWLVWATDYLDKAYLV